MVKPKTPPLARTIIVVLLFFYSVEFLHSTAIRGVNERGLGLGPTRLLPLKSLTLKISIPFKIASTKLVTNILVLACRKIKRFIFFSLPRPNINTV